VPPHVRLSAPPSQSILRRRFVTLHVTVDEACTLTASGVVRVSERTAAAPLARVGAALDHEGSTTLRLRLSSASARRLAKLLEPKRHGDALILVRATDLFGNAAVARLSIRFAG
jgi:hypothetical protein